MSATIDADHGTVLASLRRETEVLVDRALTVFLEYDFLAYSVLGGTLTGGHVVTYLAREADRMANALLAATGRPLPPRDRNREWEIEEGGNLRPGAVLIDDLHVATSRLEESLAGVVDWATLPAELQEIPARRLLQLVVHHADLGRPWDALPEDDAAAAVGVLPAVLAPELAGLRLLVDPDLSRLRTAAGTDATTLVEGPARLLLAWATGREDASMGIPTGSPRPTIRELI